VPTIFLFHLIGLLLWFFPLLHRDNFLNSILPLNISFIPQEPTQVTLSLESPLENLSQTNSSSLWTLISVYWIRQFVLGEKSTILEPKIPRFEYFLKFISCRQIFLYFKSLMCRIIFNSKSWTYNKKSVL
jgi:hypothetical protein